MDSSSDLGEDTLVPPEGEPEEVDETTRLNESTRLCDSTDVMFL